MAATAGFRHVWPTMTCSDPQTEGKLALTRRQAVRGSSLMMHSYISNAAAHSLRRYPPGHPSRNILAQAWIYHERKALDSISEVLKRQPGIIPDGVFVAFLVAGFPPGDYDDYVSNYPASPLATAQCLHLYTGLELTRSRIQLIQWMSALLDIRGGLDAVAQHDWVNAATL